MREHKYPVIPSLYAVIFVESPTYTYDKTTPIGRFTALRSYVSKGLKQLYLAMQGAHNRTNRLRKKFKRLLKCRLMRSSGNECAETLYAPSTDTPPADAPPNDTPSKTVAGTVD
jgi:hypothetical protein